MTSHLARMNCSSRCGPSLDSSEIESHLSSLQGWKVTEGEAIEKCFSFKNFYRTMAFANALAWIAHTENHHPDLVISFNQCVVRFKTHSVNGLSLNDFICAAKTDALEIPVE